MTSRQFTEFGLSAGTMKAIARLGFEQPSPIQAEAIPPLLSGQDVVGQSQTGSGKTAAFAIPAIERLDPADRCVQVLILCPTRELAVQVSEEVHKLAFFKSGVRPLPIYGGQSYDRQFAGLRAGANIVIGTPGRIMDHMNRGSLLLDKVRIVVLDEADEMLNMGFRDDIEFILKAVPQERQTVLFSATVPRAIEELIARYTRTPTRVRIEGQALTVPTVEQAYVEVDRRWKMEALERLIDLHDVNRGIVFCNTQRMVDTLSEHMNAAGYSADCIHGGMAQSARDRVMKKFRTGGVEFLVATDVAARGIDVDDIQVVFNYDLPYDGEDYVHRVGRTGRAGRNGLAISFASGREVFQIRQIERYTRQRMRRAEVPTHGEIEEARLNQVVQKVRETIGSGDFRHYDRILEGLLEEGINSLDLSNALFHMVAGSTAPAPRAAESPQAGGARTPRPPAPVRSEATPPASTRVKTVAAPAPAAEPVADTVAEAVAEAAAEPSATRAPEPEPEPQQELEPEPKPAAVLPPVAKAPPVKPRAATPPPYAKAHEARGPKPAKKPWKSPGDRSTEGKPGPAPHSKWERRSPSAKPWETRPKAQFIPRNRGAGDGHEGRPPFPPKQAYGPGEMPVRRPGTGTRPPPGTMTRLWLSVGSEHGISPAHVKGCILGETGVPAETLGRIDLRERHTFVELSNNQVAAVLPKLNRAFLGGRRLKAKVA